MSNQEFQNIAFMALLVSIAAALAAVTVTAGPEVTTILSVVSVGALIVALLSFIASMRG